ncbi:MAG TPA: hypothetical protein VNX21_09765, partial [Candidatus Thermoplasmatota archaeon]|nr:hypothetical protein [Candidatus Thermoplasmatota archaeon]
MRRAWKLANLSPRTRAFLLSAALGVVTLLVTAIVEALWGDVPDLQAKLIEWGVVGLGVGAASLVALWPLRSAIGLMWDLSEKTSGPHGKAIVPFVQAHLERLHAVSLQMLKPKGTVLSLEEVNTLTELVFDHSQGVYDGTDSNVPSKYTRLYPEYLRQHADSLGGPKERGTRILIVESGALREDAAATPDAYREFVQWHKDHGVRLLHAEPTRAR